MAQQRLFLVYISGASLPDECTIEPRCRLDDGLYLVMSSLTQSRLYHKVKRNLPQDTPLLVAEAAGPPKFKGMKAGSTRWLRDQDVPSPGQTPA